MNRTWLSRRLVPYRVRPRPAAPLPFRRAGAGWGLLALGGLFSLGLHGLVAGALGRGPGRRTPRPILVPVVSRPAEKPNKADKPVPRPRPEAPRPVQPRPMARPRPLVHTHHVVHHRPRTNAPPPREVFGVTRHSLAKADGAGVAVRVGNTLMKEQEKKYTPPTKVQDLPEEPRVAPPPPPPPRPRPRPMPRTYDLNRVTTKPRFIKRVAPRYSDAAQDEEIEGVVKVEVVLDRNGRVMKVRVIKSLGYGLDQAVVRAVKASRFSPARMGSRPVRCRLIIPYRFHLAD